jgi:hypothetical protein
MPTRTSVKLRDAFAALETQLHSLRQPYEPRFEADADDIRDWAEHVDQVLEATRQYTRAILDHLDDVTPGRLNADVGGLTDAASDLVGTLRKAADELGEAKADTPVAFPRGRTFPTRKVGAA